MRQRASAHYGVAFCRSIAKARLIAKTSWPPIKRNTDATSIPKIGQTDAVDWVPRILARITKSMQNNSAATALIQKCQIAAVRFICNIHREYTNATTANSAAIPNKQIWGEIT